MKEGMYSLRELSGSGLRGFAGGMMAISSEELEDDTLTLYAAIPLSSV